MRILRLLPILCLAILSVSYGTAAAQSSSGSSSSQESSAASSEAQAAPSVPDETPEIIGSRAARVQDFRKLTIKFQTPERQYRDRRAVFIKKRAELHADCREQLRRSNRDTKYSITADCYADELKLEQDFLAQELTYLEQVPTQSKLIRRSVITQHTLLSDAVDAITIALESRLLSSEEEINEARTNLRTKYRAPYREALQIARIDRLLSWNAYLLQRVDEAIAEEQKEQGSVRPDWAALRLCLRESEAFARPIVLNQELPIGALAALQAKQTACMDQLEGITNIRKVTGSGETVPMAQ